jgi:hypothetical protein
MGHDFRDKLKDTGRLEQFYTPIYRNKMKYNMLLHFSDNMKQPDKDDNNCDRLLKMRTLFYHLSDAYAKFYSSEEHLAMYKVIVLLKVKLNFKKYIPKKHKCFGIKIYKLHHDWQYI